MSIVWVNIDKPTKKCTIHSNDSCQYVVNKKETLLKGIVNLKKDGGWKSFTDHNEATTCCKKLEKDKGYYINTCC